MMSVALRMMQGASSLSCSKHVTVCGKQDVPRVSPALSCIRVTRNSAVTANHRWGDHFSSLIAQAVRGDQQVHIQYRFSLDYQVPDYTRGAARHTKFSIVTAWSAPQVEQLSNAALELISQITRKADDEHAATLERNRATLEGLVDQDVPAELKRKVLATVTALKEGLLERETEVKGRFILTVSNLNIPKRILWDLESHFLP